MYVLWWLGLVVGVSGCLHEIDCGYPGITQHQCEQLGCCFESKEKDWCSAPACNTTTPTCGGHGTCQGTECRCDPPWGGWDCKETTITTVHVVEACHLDVGFADSAVGIINRYFDHHFPMIISVADELRQEGGDAQLKFTAQSYVVSLYLDCPVGMGLHCPTAAEKAKFEAAIHNGSITWHAFPFNAELEMYNQEMVVEGLDLTHRLDKQFGLSPKATLSQRDVPGTTRAIIPILKKAGVTAISVGVNAASTPPGVPKAFVWKDPVSGDDILAMWHPHGYGGYDKNSAVTVPGSPHAMVTDWNGDNAGPFDAKTYKAQFAAIAKEFPGAKVVASTFDEFASLVLPHKDALPVISSEIGDTWIYGCPSDPKKVATMRALDRTWASYLKSGGQRDPVYLNATRLMMKLGEHTWGRDVKSNLKDNKAWSNTAFNTARAGPERGQFGILEESWWEQRRWGIDIPMQALEDGGHPLAKRAKAAIDELNPSVPNLSGFTKVDHVTGHVFTCGAYSVSFDGTTGAIIGLNHTKSGSWADSTHPLGLFEYHSYSMADFEAFLKAYIGPNPPSWAMHDFGKPDDTVSKHIIVTTQLQGLWVKSGSSSTMFAASLHMSDPSVTVDYGGPSQIWMEWNVDHTTGVSLRANVMNKTATRLPEVMFLRFQPSPGGVEWDMSKLGSWMSTQDVVKGGSPHHHGVDEGLRYQPSSGRTFNLHSTDASVFCVGEPLGFPTPTNSTPDTKNHGVAAMLWNNLWGTNYVMWVPFHKDYQPVKGEGDFLFRFSLTM